MRGLQEITGLPVIVNGACAGHVICGEPDEALEFIRSIWISTGRMGARRIDRAHVRQIGDIAVRAENRGTRGEPACGRFFRRAISTDGVRLGAIVDVEFDESLKICALCLTHGYPDDLLTGRRRITRYSVRKSDGCVLVPSGEEEQP